MEDIDTFLNDSGFTFKETDDGLSMTLTKDIGDNTVEIQFDARQPLPDDMPENENAEEDEENPSENYCDFTVYISSKYGQNGLVVDATTMDTEIAYNNVMVTDNMDRVRGL